MTQDRLNQPVPARLAEMMTLDPTPPRLWSPEELGIILRHQLAVPLEFDLGDLSKDSATIAGPRPMLSTTFNDLLHHRKPLLSMLQRVKRFAKACKSDPKGPLPEEVATVLYYAAVVAALLHCRQRITTLTDAALRQGVEWVLAQPWVDDLTRSLFRDALSRLSEPIDEVQG